MSIQAVGWTNTGNCCGNQQIKPRYQVFLDRIYYVYIKLQIYVFFKLKKVINNEIRSQ